LSANPSGKGFRVKETAFVLGHPIGMCGIEFLFQFGFGFVFEKSSDHLVWIEFGSVQFEKNTVQFGYSYLLLTYKLSSSFFLSYLG